MARNPLTEAELDWFDIKRYRTRDLPLSHWVRIIEHRLIASFLADQEGLSKVNAEFLASIVRDPMAIYGARPYAPELSNDADTPSVRYLRVADCELLGRMCWLNKLQSSNCYDLSDKPHWLEGQVDDVAHIQVDLMATKAQLLDDFNTWLDKVYALRRVKPTSRRYVEKVRAWSDGKYLPFFDLHLFEKATRRKVPQELKCRLLDLGGEAPLADRLRVPSKSLKVFTQETLRAMKLQVR